MSRDKLAMDVPLLQSVRMKDAVFAGWQKAKSGRAMALYTITASGHPSLGSTVSRDSLRRLHLGIPWTPPRRTFTNGESFQEWDP